MADQPIAGLVVSVLLCFGIGYWIVSYYLDKRSPQVGTRSNPRNDQDGRNRGAPTQGTRDDRYEDRKAHFGSAEEYYRHVLGVSSSSGELEIKTAYRQLLNKYHPDRVNGLGDEFLDLASRRTKELIEAYEYLSRKYGFR
jgi:hypothetical protein